MDFSVPKLNRTSALIAFKSTFALTLGFGIAFALDWKPSFMGILIVVLQTAALGSTLKKGVLYIAGTLGGAVVGVAMVALFAHDRFSFILAMAVLLGICLYAIQGSRYPYAWLIFAVTCALVGWLSAQHPPVAFGLAVMRASTICLAVALTFLVHGILWPIRAENAFERQLRDFVEGCRSLLSLTRRSLAGDRPEPGIFKTAETSQAKAIAALRTSLEAAASETPRFRRFQPGYQQLVDELHALLRGLVAVQESITASCRASNPDEFRPALNEIGGGLERLAGALAEPRDGSAGVSPAPSTDPPEDGDADTVFAAMIGEQLKDVAAQVTKVRATLRAVEDPAEATASPPARARAPFRITGPRFRKAATGSLVLLATVSIFIPTNWPGGLQMAMIFATVTITFGTLFPLMLVSRQLYLSLLIGPAIAAPLYFGIMPGIDRYGVLIPWLFVVFLPLFYLINSPNPRTSMMMLFSTMFVIILMNLAGEGQSYSFSFFVTTWITLAGAFGIPLLIFGLFSSLVPERAFRKQVQAFFGGCEKSLRDLEKPPAETPTGEAVVNAGEKQWQGIVKQLRLWSSVIDYRRISADSREATQALIESIERAALSLSSAMTARRKLTPLPPLNEPITSLHDACARSFGTIASSLADLRSAPVLPDIDGLVAEVGSLGGDILETTSGTAEASRADVLRAMGVAAHYEALSDAIQDCRNKVNALDWRAWNRNYF